MPTLTDFDSFLLITAIAATLLFIVWLDRYLTRRRSAAINANYVRRVVAEATSIVTPIRAVAHTKALLFRRQRALRDSFGQVVAVQFEEITADELESADIIMPRRHTVLLTAAA
jgi:hypothetical protein